MFTEAVNSNPLNKKKSSFIVLPFYVMITIWTLRRLTWTYNTRM